MDTTTGNRCVCLSVGVATVILRLPFLWSFCGRFVVNLWSFCGRFVAILWSICGQFVAILWPFIRHFADAFSLGEKQERMQYEILDEIWGGKPTTTTEAGRTQRYVATKTFCDRPTRFQRRHELFQATNPPTDGKMESTSFSVPLGIASSDYIGRTCSVEWFQMDCVDRGNWKRQSWMTCGCAYILVGCSNSSSSRLWSLLLRNRRLPDFKVLLSLSCL